MWPSRTPHPLPRYTYAVSHAGSSDGSVVSSLTVGDNVSGTTTYVNGDTDNDTLLEAGETRNFTDAHVITPTSADPLVNTATATGTDRDGDSISDTDTHTLPVSFVPVIQIAKSGPATANVGDTVTCTYAVTHATDSDTDGGTFETAGITINGNDVVGTDAGRLRPLGFGDIAATRRASRQPGRCPRESGLTSRPASRISAATFRWSPTRQRDRRCHARVRARADADARIDPRLDR